MKLNFLNKFTKITLFSMSILILSITSLIYAEEGKVRISPVSNSVSEKVTQGETEDILIQAVGASFREDINKNNYEEYFDIFDAPKGCKVDYVKRLNPYILKLRLGGFIPLCDDENVTIRFNENAFNEKSISGEDIELDNTKIEIEIKKGIPNAEFSNTYGMSEKQLLEGFDIKDEIYEGFSEFPVIKVDRGTFKKDVSNEDIDVDVDNAPLGYEAYVTRKSVDEIYFTFIPNLEDCKYPADLSKDYDNIEVTIKKSAFNEDIKDDVGPIKFKIEDDLNSYNEDYMDFKVKLNNQGVVKCEFYKKNNDNPEIKKLIPCKKGENSFFIDTKNLSGEYNLTFKDINGNIIYEEPFNFKVNKELVTSNGKPINTEGNNYIIEYDVKSKSNIKFIKVDNTTNYKSNFKNIGTKEKGSYKEEISDFDFGNYYLEIIAEEEN